MFTYSVYIARCKRHLIYNLIGYWDFDEATPIVLCCFDKDWYKDNYLKKCRKIMKIFFNYRAFAFSVNFNKTIKFGAYIQRKRKCMN